MIREMQDGEIIKNEWETSVVSRLFAQIDPVSSREKDLLVEIKKCFEEHRLRYERCGQNNKALAFDVSFNSQVRFKACIEVKDTKIYFRIKYPFAGCYETIPILCLYAAGINHRFKDEYDDLYLDVDVDLGEIHMCRLISTNSLFDKDEFMRTVMKTLQSAADSFAALKDITERKGNISKKYSHMIKRCFKKACPDEGGKEDMPLRPGKPALTFEEFMNLQDHHGRKAFDELEKKEPMEMTALDYFKMKFEEENDDGEDEDAADGGEG